MVSNSLHQKGELVLPSSPAVIENVWDYFYNDRVRVYKRGLFLNVVSRPLVAEENHVNLLMYQLSGQRFRYLKEFFSYDSGTDAYDRMKEESESLIWSMLNNQM